MSGIETLYAVLLVVALTLNGIAVAGAMPFRRMLAPLRDARTITLVVLLDLILVPLVVVGSATLLAVDPVTRAGLVIVAASSCGPIAIGLTRIVRGDVATSVTLVLGLGALNIVTVPAITGLLLPEGLTIPLPSLLTSLLGLALAPLVLGRAVAHLLARRGRGPERIATTLRLVGRASDVALAGAVTVALLLEPRAVADVLAGPVLLAAAATMVVVVVAARSITQDPAVRRTIAVTINARAVGLALAVATLHLGDVDGLRAVVLAFGGLMQAVPALLALTVRLFGSGSTEGATVAQD